MVQALILSLPVLAKPGCQSASNLLSALSASSGLFFELAIRFFQRLYEVTPSPDHPRSLSALLAVRFHYRLLRLRVHE